MPLREVLNKPVAYRAFAALIGSERARATMAKDYIRAREGDRVLDIGCGTADWIAYLPRVDYRGFDENLAYIEQAKRRWAGRGEFTCERVTEYSVESAQYDVVLAMGILHHLDDRSAHELMRIAWRALRTAGRLITLDGVYVPRQSPIARFLLSKDRGRFVRSQAEYESLARASFSAVESSVKNDLLAPLPYTHLIMECTKTGA